jgi:uncharacterized protein (DUF2384 family)
MVAGASGRVLFKDAETATDLPDDAMHAHSDHVTPLEPEPEPWSRNEVEIIRRASEVLGVTHVAQWMRSRIPSLGEHTPYELLQTEEGRKQVERVLLKIEHGVY